jgi:hypothetical protein
VAKATTTIETLKAFDNGPLHFFNALHNKLRNTVATFNAVRMCGVGIQNDDL